MLKLHDLVDDARCFEKVRNLRWPEGVVCPNCQWKEIMRSGYDETQPARQRYLCKGCDARFDDLTDTIFAGHHQPLKTWVLCLYLMGLNLSNDQIAQELDLHRDDVHDMTSQLREGILKRKQEVKLEAVVECDEVYVVAGHNGHPEEVKKKAAKDAEIG